MNLVIGIGIEEFCHLDTQYINVVYVSILNIKVVGDSIQAGSLCYFTFRTDTRGREILQTPEHEHDFESPYDASLALLDKLNQFPRLAYIPETLFQFFHRLFRVQFCSVQDTVRFL
jgi:hypothetical protein